MQKKGIGIGVGILVIIGIGILLFTNVDELTFSVIDESLDQVEVDSRTYSMLTNTFPVTSICDYALIYIESYYRPPHGDHTEWYYQNFGDILDVYKEDYSILIEKGINWDDPELDVIHQKYVEKIKTRINPSLFDEFPFSKPTYSSLILLSSTHLDEDLECAELLESNYEQYIHVMEDDEYQKLLQTAEGLK